MLEKGGKGEGSLPLHRSDGGLCVFFLPQFRCDGSAFRCRRVCFLPDQQTEVGEGQGGPGSTVSGVHPGGDDFPTGRLLRGKRVFRVQAGHGIDVWRGRSHLPGTEIHQERPEYQYFPGGAFDGYG